ncbi:uncharacterized protein [Ptychodera flava]
MFKVSRKFFSLSNDIKMKYAADVAQRENDHGFVQTEGERVDTSIPHGDLKESFNYVNSDKQKTMPDEELPEFREILLDFYKQCTELSLKILDIMGQGLYMDDPGLFLKTHTGMDGGDNDTTLRTLYYPSIPENLAIKEGQQRCGIHTDYGSLTLLFQDTTGGLEVMNRSGEWVSATPIENTVLVNIGDLMQRWTSDTLKSTKHRVLMPKTKETKSKERQSLVFFVFPDRETVVKCTDNSDKYPPIKSMDYLKQLLAATY